MSYPLRATAAHRVLILLLWPMLAAAQVMEPPPFPCLSGHFHPNPARCDFVFFGSIEGITMWRFKKPMQLDGRTCYLTPRATVTVAQMRPYLVKHGRSIDLSLFHRQIAAAQAAQWVSELPITRLALTAQRYGDQFPIAACPPWLSSLSIQGYQITRETIDALLRRCPGVEHLQIWNCVVEPKALGGLASAFRLRELAILNRPDKPPLPAAVIAPLLELRSTKLAGLFVRNVEQPDAFFSRLAATQPGLSSVGISLPRDADTASLIKALARYPRLNRVVFTEPYLAQAFRLAIGKRLPKVKVE